MLLQIKLPATLGARAGRALSPENRSVLGFCQIVSFFKKTWPLQMGEYLPGPILGVKGIYR